MEQVGAGGSDSVTLRPRRRPLAARLWRLARRQPVGAGSLVLVLLIVLVAVVGPAIAPYDLNVSDTRARLSGPSLTHPFGTDNLGRDILSRVIAGTRIAFLVSSASIALGVSLGALIGLVSGWFRGALDTLLQRLIDAMMAIPALVLAMAIVAVLGQGLDKLIIALAAFQVPTAARTVYGTVLSAREEVYVDAAIALGAPTSRVLVRHILPNILAPLLVIVSVQIGTVIVSEAALSFVGLGVQPPAVSWGSMLKDAQTYLETGPWLIIFPTAAIGVTVLSLNFLGDTLRDIWDPKLRGR